MIERAWERSKSIVKDFIAGSPEVISGYKAHDGDVLYDNTLEGQMASMNPHQKVIEVTARREGLFGKKKIERVRYPRRGVVVVKR